MGEWSNLTSIFFNWVETTTQDIVSPEFLPRFKTVSNQSILHKSVAFLMIPNHCNFNIYSCQPGAVGNTSKSGFGPPGVFSPLLGWPSKVTWSWKRHRGVRVLVCLGRIGKIEENEWDFSGKRIIPYFSNRWWKRMIKGDVSDFKYEHKHLHSVWCWFIPLACWFDLLVIVPKMPLLQTFVPCLGNSKNSPVKQLPSKRNGTHSPVKFTGNMDIQNVAAMHEAGEAISKPLFLISIRGCQTFTISTGRWLDAPWSGCHRLLWLPLCSQAGGRGTEDIEETKSSGRGKHGKTNNFW